MTLRWLEEVFDPFTRERAGGGRQRRPLFLDGADAHTKVDFLKACWARNIVCVMPPAHLTGIFQPLDVDSSTNRRASFTSTLMPTHLGYLLPALPRVPSLHGIRKLGRRAQHHGRFEEHGQRLVSGHQARGSWLHKEEGISPQSCSSLAQRSPLPLRRHKRLGV